MRIAFIAIGLSLAAFTASVEAGVRLAPNIYEGMVLQENAGCAIAGYTDPGATISVVFRGKNFKTAAQKDGQFRLEIASGKAGGPFEMKIDEAAPTTEPATAASAPSTAPASSYVFNNIHVGPDWVSPAGIISNGMVLQRECNCPIWGTAKPGSKVTITFRDQTTETTANGKGRFRVDIPSGKAGGPFAMSLEGANKLAFQSVYVGEVWVCSGQSNMGYSMGLKGGQEAAANLPGIIRLSTAAGWTDATADTLPNFSAVAFGFGSALSKDLKVPIGLIFRWWGGSEAERWLPPATAQKLDLTVDGEIYTMAGEQLHYLQAERKAKILGDAYLGAIKPLQPYAIRGVIWYQGESNEGASSDWYTKILGGMITGWREEWGQGDFPFLIVQLPRIYMSGKWETAAAPPWTAATSGDAWCYVRDAQRRVLSLPNTALEVTYDFSDGDMHPRIKKPYAERAALVARGAFYKEKIDFSGPLLSGWKWTGDQLVLSFDYADGLSTGSTGYDKAMAHASPDLKVADVLVVDDNGKKTPAHARIDGSSVVVDMKGHEDAVTLFYAGGANPKGNLYNKGLLPASPFRIVLKPDKLSQDSAPATRPASAPAN